VNRFAEYAQEIPAADLSHLIPGKTSFQHRIDNDVVKPGRLVRPCLIGPFTDAWWMLTATRRAAGWRSITAE
jgi:hypothetical protein